MAGNKERTFIMVKPDGVQRNLVGKIIQRFEEKGFKLVAMKFMWVSTLIEKVAKRLIDFFFFFLLRCHMVLIIIAFSLIHVQ